MPKSISGATQTHLQQEVTTLATCWEIKRNDGKFFRFTDNSVNLTISGDSYRADAGYTRSALSNTSDLSVDSVEVDGFYQTDAITEDDLRKGLFDFAQVRIFLVNYEDTTQTIKLRRGNLGEVQTQSGDRFKAELRSLAQGLQQNIGTLYQATCRANLGDGQCRFPLQPSVMLRNTSYSVGEFLRVDTFTPRKFPARFTIPITNGGFESLTGWTTVEGDPAIIASRNGIGPFAGSNFLHGNVTASTSGYVIRQDIDITLLSGFDQTDLDGGGYVFNGSVRLLQSLESSRHAGRIRVEAIDSSGEVLQELWNSRFELRTREVWNLLTKDDAILPAGTNTLRFWVEGGNYSSSGVAEIGFDDLQAQILNFGSGSMGSQSFYEDRIYECTTAGVTSGTVPTYDLTVGNTTTDGTAVFTARDAFTRSAVVASVTDRRTFSVTWNAHPNSADGWLNGGSVVWETGNNAGSAIEIKDHVNSGSVITLFLQMSKDIQVGDRLRMSPGCNKLLATCRDKFVIPNSQDFSNGNVKNIDSEPDIPGPDFILTYPDAE